MGKIKKVYECLQGLFVFNCVLNFVFNVYVLIFCVWSSVKMCFFPLCTVSEALSDGPSCFSVLFMMNISRTTHQNQAVCFDQPLDRKHNEQLRGNVAFNISRMFVASEKNCNRFHFGENRISWSLSTSLCQPVLITAQISSSHESVWLLAIEHLGPLSKT